MSHLSSENILCYLDGDESRFNLARTSRHLDKCNRCTSKLKELAALNILLELSNITIREDKETELLANCPDTETVIHMIENQLSEDKKMKIKRHLEECKYCNEEWDILQTIEETPEVKAPEIREARIFQPKILRYFELYFVACEREILEKEKGFRIPGLESIREMLLPKQAALAPLGFAELIRRNAEFYRELNDREIMQACKRGDNMAWNELEQRFRNYAYTIIRALGLKEDWEDIWQEIQLALVTSIKSYEERGKARFFLRKIIVNICRKKRRKKIREKKFLGQLYEKTKQKTKDSPQEKKVVEKEEAMHLIENIKKLPEEYSAILMSMINELRDKEIANLLKIPIETVRTRKLRAKIRLYEMKKNEPDFLSKIKRFEWVKRNFYKFFTP